MNGIECAAEIRKICKSSYIVALTGNEDFED